jgi:hypothetical protein
MGICLSVNGYLSIGEWASVNSGLPYAPRPVPLPLVRGLGIMTSFGWAFLHSTCDHMSEGDSNEFELTSLHDFVGSVHWSILPIGRQTNVHKASSTTYHLIVYLVEVNLANFIYNIFAFEGNKTKTCVMEMRGRGRRERNNNVIIKCKCSVIFQRI